MMDKIEIRGYKNDSSVKEALSDKQTDLSPTNKKIIITIIIIPEWKFKSSLIIPTPCEGMDKKCRMFIMSLL